MSLARFGDILVREAGRVRVGREGQGHVDVVRLHLQRARRAMKKQEAVLKATAVRSPLRR